MHSKRDNKNFFMKLINTSIKKLNDQKFYKTESTGYSNEIMSYSKKHNKNHLNNGFFRAFYSSYALTTKFILNLLKIID